MAIGPRDRFDFVELAPWTYPGCRTGNPVARDAEFCASLSADPVTVPPVADNYLTPLAEMRPTIDAGYGAVAVAPIPAGTIVACFGGATMDRATFDTMPADRRSRSIQIDDDTFLLGPVEREPGDAINHSCDPNCGMGGAAQVVAMRDITAGETLTFDYAMADGSNYDEFDCACGAANCRGRVTGSDWSREDLRTRYAGYTSPYLVRRFAAATTAKRLGKSDAENLMNSYDADPVEALTVALRIVLGRPHATFETLVALAPLPADVRRRLVSLDQGELDLLVRTLNEDRALS